MTIIDLDQLATVTGGRGGCGMQQQPQQPQQPQQQEAGAAPQQGGNTLAGLDQFLSFFQSDGFQQILGGLRGLLGQMGGQMGGAPQQQAPQAQQAAQ